MTSEKQIKANRNNAQKSTGPKTAEGKEIVRYNALGHGLRAETVLLLPGEDSEELSNLSEQLRTELEPVGALESFLAEQIVASVWRLRRANQIETGILAWEYYRIRSEEAFQEVKQYEEGGGMMDIFPVTITDEHKHEEALQKALEIAALKHADIPTLGLTFTNMQDTFPKLTRYQTALERSLYRAIDALRDMQEHRKSTAA